MKRALAISAVAAALLVGVYAALGGGDYDVARPPDPCGRKAPDDRAGLFGAAQRFGLNALNMTACDLGVSRERLVLVLAGEVDPPPGLDEERRGDAFRAGLRRAIDEEVRAGRLGETEAALARAALELAPVEELLEQMFVPR